MVLILICDIVSSHATPIIIPIEFLCVSFVVSDSWWKKSWIVGWKLGRCVLIVVSRSRPVRISRMEGNFIDVDSFARRKRILFVLLEFAVLGMAAVVAVLDIIDKRFEVVLAGTKVFWGILPEVAPFGWTWAIFWEHIVRTAFGHFFTDQFVYWVFMLVCCWWYLRTLIKQD